MLLTVAGWTQSLGTDPPRSGLCFGKGRHDPCVGQDGITIELVLALGVLAVIVVYLALRISDIGRPEPRPRRHRRAAQPRRRR